MQTFSASSKLLAFITPFVNLRKWLIVAQYDVAGPVYYKGYYHLFYQYNPNAAIPGTIEWGHVVSKDLIRWRFLESALKRDKWYDVNGVWSGSITFLDNGDPVILYTGNSVNNTQSQARADPEDPSDPLLRKWVKVSASPSPLQQGLFNKVRVLFGYISSWEPYIGLVFGSVKITETNTIKTHAQNRLDYVFELYLVLHTR